MKQQQQYHPHRVRGSSTPVWLVLLGMLAMVTWVHIRSSQHMFHVQDSSSSSSSLISSSSGGLAVSLASSSLVPQPGCEAAARPAVALMMVILGHDNATRHDQYWLAVANRRAYALQHDYPLYLVTDTMGSGEHPAWEKLVALQAVLQHSCADWVWMNDADAYVMNLARDVLDVARHPLAHRHPHQGCNTSRPDVIASGACLTRINTGSILWRNSPWTAEFVGNAWHSKFIARPANWWDQAAVLHMAKVGDSAAHMCIVKGRALNAFANVTNCHDGSGTFKEGDLLVHFPGGMKKVIAGMASPWLQAVPVLPSRLGDASAHAPVFTVTRASSSSAHSTPAAAAAHTRTVRVDMQTSLYDKNSTMQRKFKLHVTPQMEGFENWGWPIVHEPEGFRALLQRQLLQWQGHQER